MKIYIGVRVLTKNGFEPEQATEEQLIEEVYRYPTRRADYPFMGRWELDEFARAFNEDSYADFNPTVYWIKFVL